MSRDTRMDVGGEIGAWQIVSLRPSEDGAYLYLRLRPSGGGRGEQLRLRIEEYGELPFKVTSGRELTAEQVEALRAAERASAAYQRGVNMLGYGANSSRTLKQKLQQKGYDAEVAARAVEALSTRGYLCETRDACRLSRQIMRRGRGLRRILQELRARGYGDEALSAVEDELAEEDFSALCIEVVRKKYRQIPQDRDERQRLIAALIRAGFEMSDVRAALRALDTQEHN